MKFTTEEAAYIDEINSGLLDKVQIVQCTPENIDQLRAQYCSQTSYQLRIGDSVRVRLPPSYSSKL